MTAGDSREKIREHGAARLPRRRRAAAVLRRSSAASSSRCSGCRLGAFRVAGGILLLITALDMLRARPSETRTTPPRSRRASAKEDVALVPLAMPLLAGPGAIATAMVLMSKGDEPAIGRRRWSPAIVLTFAASYFMLRRRAPGAAGAQAVRRGHPRARDGAHPRRHRRAVHGGRGEGRCSGTEQSAPADPATRRRPAHHALGSAAHRQLLRAGALRVVRVAALDLLQVHHHRVHAVAAWTTWNGSLPHSGDPPRRSAPASPPPGLRTKTITGTVGSCPPRRTRRILGRHGLAQQRLDERALLLLLLHALRTGTVCAQPTMPARPRPA